MRKPLNRAVSTLLALLLGIMTINVLWGVFTRYLMGAQSPWTEELARFLLIWVGLLGAAYVSGQRKHLSIDLLPARLEGRAERRLLHFIDLLVIAFAICVLIIGGLRLIYITYKLGQTSAALQLPLAAVYFVVPLSGVLIVIYKLADWRKPEPAEKN